MSATPRVRGDAADYTPGVPIGVITLTFDPVVRLSETASVRLETIALAIVLLGGLILAARIGAITPAFGRSEPAPGLRMDDLVFIVVGAVPGAIVGGRLGYVLDHLEFYRANPAAVVDVAQGGLSPTLAVPFGILTAMLIARLLGAPVGRWLHAAALPLLFVLGAGKLVGVLGASGQGAASDLAWATAYAGPGPWGSLGADIPSHPSQVYEAILVGVAMVVVALLSRLEFIARRSGGALFVALGLWATARFVAAFTWRDPATAGPLRMEQLLLVAVAIVAVLGLVASRRRRGIVSGTVEPYAEGIPT
jgi:phosphatidylglycerol:prolipoprotein diacylglycerol transferase